MIFLKGNFNQDISARINKICEIACRAAINLIQLELTVDFAVGGPSCVQAYGRKLNQHMMLMKIKWDENGKPVFSYNN